MELFSLERDDAGADLGAYGFGGTGGDGVEDRLRLSVLERAGLAVVGRDGNQAKRNGFLVDCHADGEAAHGFPEFLVEDEVAEGVDDWDGMRGVRC